MKTNKFEELLLDNHIVDSRNLYVILVKKKLFFPSFKIMVMGLYKEHFVFHTISTSYKLKEHIIDIDVKTIQTIDVHKKSSELVLSLYLNKQRKDYLVLENQKNAYSIKKILKK